MIYNWVWNFWDEYIRRNWDQTINTPYRKPKKINFWYNKEKWIWDIKNSYVQY